MQKVTVVISCVHVCMCTCACGHARARVMEKFYNPGFQKKNCSGATASLASSNAANYT